MEEKFSAFFRFIYILLIGAALLLLSAVSEHGETEMSRVLVGNFHDVPEMIEALIAGFALTALGAAAASYLLKNGT
ncbi:MAG: hypothetical protein IJS45_05850 [Clostridia bacterium]|nr:hypothetical protein [Clostridia bacterium]